MAPDQHHLFKNAIQKKRHVDAYRAQSFANQQYNKALFTLSFLVSLQLRKYMELFTQISQMRPSDLADPNIIAQKQEQINQTLVKFKKHFTQNLDSLHQKEVHKKISPKFTVCFMELGNYLGVKLGQESVGHISHSEKAFKTIDRNQPSIIKEEEELEVDGEELGNDEKESKSELKKEEGSTSHVHFESTERERNEEEER